MTPPTVALLGATGRVGGWVLEECLERGCTVRALCRKPEKLRDYADRMDTIQGDATNEVDIAELVTDQVDTIISTIGSPSNDILVVEASAKALVAVLSKREEFPRIIWMTSTGINEATDQAKSYPACGAPSQWCCGYGLFGWIVFHVMIPCIIGQDLWNDMALSEDVLRENEEIYTKTVIVRPTNMTPVSEHAVFSEEWRKGGGTNTDYILVNADDPPPNKWICRRAIARALVDLIMDTSHDGTAVSLFAKQ